MAFYKEDIIDIDLENGNISRNFLNHSIGLGDCMGNRFGIRVFRNGQEVNIEDSTCSGFFMAPDGENILISGSTYTYRNGNIAWVLLPQACYDYEGQFTLAIKLSDGTVTGTMRIIDGVVSNTGTNNPVAPRDTVPTYQEILSVYQQMLEAKAGSVRYDIAQSLTAEQQKQGRDNIGAVLDAFVGNTKAFFSPISEGEAIGDFADCAVITKKLTKGTLLKTVSYKASKAHTPILIIANTSMKVLYKEVKSGAVAYQDTVTFTLDAFFPEDAYIIVSCPMFKFSASQGTHSNFTVVSYSNASGATVGSTLTISDDSGLDIGYLVTITVCENGIKDKMFKNEAYITPSSDTGGQMEDFCVLYPQIPKDVAITGVRWGVAAHTGSVYPTLLIMNASDHKLLYKESAPYLCGQDSVASIDLPDLNFGVPVLIAVSCPKFLVNAATGTSMQFDSILYSNGASATVGSVVPFVEQPTPLTIGYEAEVKVDVFKYGGSGSFGGIITVGKTDDAMYPTLTQAVTAAHDGDTILVFPGTYENEEVKAWTKTVNIMGVDRDSVIIKNNSNHYEHPAIEMCTGSLRNLTVWQDSDVAEDTSTSNPYAVHIEADTLQNSRFIIEDCNLFARYSAAIGMGLRQYGKVTIRNCELSTTHNLLPNGRHIGAVFAHPGYDGNVGYLEIIQSQLISIYGTALEFEKVFQSAGASLNVTVQNTFLWSDQLGAVPGVVGEHGTGEQNVFISPKTFGNNVNISL